MNVPIPLLLVGPALAGGLLWLGYRYLDLRRAYDRLDESALQTHRDRQRVADEFAELQGEVAMLCHVLHDSQRRWGWSWQLVPHVAALASYVDSGAAAEWLLAHAPGDWSYLRDSGVATDRLAIRTFTGWRPPRLPSARPRRRPPNKGTAA